MRDQRFVILISANSEWQAVREILSPSQVRSCPPGEFFFSDLGLFFHGGWGKISAAATTQYLIDEFHPSVLINLGTCGGFEGLVERGTIILAKRTIVYDIYEQMADPRQAITHYSTDLDLSWFDSNVLSASGSGQLEFFHGTLVSADRDILPEDIPHLTHTYGAVAADWESGSIAWVASRNKVRCLILRTVTDLVGSQGGEAYGNIEFFHEMTKKNMTLLLKYLPEWIQGIP
jgi:adenosylhomocysteine nucleosidase